MLPGTKSFVDFFYPEDLDKITEEDDSQGPQRRRKAASQAVVQQRKILLENSDGDGANDSEPDFATGRLCPNSELTLRRVSRKLLETMNVCKALLNVWCVQT